MCRDGFYVVALSGGADSVALLRVLLSLGYRVEAAHCNFKLRGEESLRDERFCAELCARLGVPLHLIHFDTLDYAALHKVSVEMAARDLRYRYFEQLRRDLGAADICVAHHRDDQVETVLLNLVRGTGLMGLQGMQPRHGHILRPLLGVSRGQVVDYLAGLGQDYVTDSTNLCDDVQRNKLRLNIIPQLETLNPAVKDNICRMTENLREVALVVQEATERSVQAVSRADGTIDLALVARQPSPMYLLWEMLAPRGFNRAQVTEMATLCDAPGTGEGGGARQWQSAEAVAVVERGRLSVVPRRVWQWVQPTLRLPEPGVYVCRAEGADGEATAEARLAVTCVAIPADYAIERSRLVAQIDAALVRFPLTLRPACEGDRFVPLGMRGTKLVSDLLTDAKATVMERRRQLVLTDASGDIIWVVGRRVSGRHALRPGTTTEMIRAEWIEKV